MSHFTDTLNPAQKEAVLNYDKPSLIVAGAGSGKTRVLTSRIADMIEQGVHPGSILALTFTNKAAREMRERIEQLVPDGRARYIWMGTFHSVFYRILRQEAGETRFRRQLHDIRHGKQRKPALDHHQGAKPQYRRIQAARHPLPHLAGEKQSRDCRGLRGQHLGSSRRRPAAEASRVLPPSSSNTPGGARPTTPMDFDDLLIYALQSLFRDFPDALEQYRTRFRYILGGRGPGYQLRAVSHRYAAWHKPAPTSAWWATTRRASTPSAEPR